MFRTGTYNRGRSRKGAWIEIKVKLTDKQREQVAPVRERGLKLWYNQHKASCNMSLP